MMTSHSIAHRRLHNQHIATARFEKPSDMVEWLGAVQAQDYPAAKWALGLRLQGATDHSIDQAFDDGSILRTHVMRPTWHFVTPVDIRWMLALTASSVHAANSYWYRRLELDDAIFARSNAVLEKGLRDGKQLTRPELVSLLRQAGIAADDLLRFTYIISRAELDGLVCSGARRGKQYTYALLEERAPQARTLDHDEALAELTRRYFRSHGPATLQDYVWWSGLKVAGARAGIELVAPELLREEIDGETYWQSTPVSPAKDSPQTAYLLPNFDEYIVGYTDRSAVFDGAHIHKLDPRGNILFSHTIVLDGRVAGTWKRTLKKSEVVLEAKLLAPLSDAETQAFTSAVERYGRFMGLQPSVGFVSGG
jgi:hypothetical protein